nr:MAG TPA: protein of unknown function DUF1829 [Caudoviricetes sp.]
MNIKQISSDYFNFITENTKFVRSTSNSLEVVTPFVDAFGDGISFVIVHSNNYYTITDRGFTIWNLKNYGIDLLNKKSNRYHILDSYLRYSGFSLTNEDIFKNVDGNQLPQAIHDMTQLLINLYDFILVSKKRVHNFFLDDVKNYFAENRDKYRYFQDFSVEGKSKLNHRMDFVFLNDSGTKLVKVHNELNTQQVNSTLVSWLDTIDKRKIDYDGNESLSLILSSDGFKRISSQHTTALQEYGIQVLDFENKDKLIKSFSSK